MIEAHFSASVILHGFTITDDSDKYTLEDGTFIHLSCPDENNGLNLIKVHTSEGVTFSYNRVKGISINQGAGCMIIHTCEDDKFLIELDYGIYTVNFDYDGTLHAYCTRG